MLFCRFPLSLIWQYLLNCNNYVFIASRLSNNSYATLRGKWRKSISWIFMWYRTASQKTDFTFLLNKAHNVRHTIFRRYLRTAVFWDIKFSISSWSIFQLCISSRIFRFSEWKQNAARSVLPRLLPRDTCRIHCYSVNLLYNYNFITSTYIRACCSFHNVWHRRYDSLTRNTCAIS